MNDTVTATTYMVLVPDTNGTYVWGIRADRIRKDKPALKSGEIAVKVKLNFKKSDLLESYPVIDMDVSSFITPEAMAAPTSVQVGA
jgi:hypothetical protein